MPIVKDIKKRLPNGLKEKFKPTVSKIPLLRRVITEPFYEPSSSAKEIYESQAKARRKEEGERLEKSGYKKAPNYFLTSGHASIDLEDNSLIVPIGSNRFTSAFKLYDGGLNALNKVATNHNQILKLLDSVPEDDRLALNIVVDGSTHFGTANICHTVEARLADILEHDRLEIRRVTILTDRGTETRIAETLPEIFADKDIPYEKEMINDQSSICLRIANPYLTSQRVVNQLFDRSLDKKILVLGWRHFLNNEEALTELKAQATQNTHTVFHIYEPIWDLPINKKTDIENLPENIVIKGKLGMRTLSNCGSEYDAVYMPADFNLTRYADGRNMLISLYLMGIRFCGDLTEVKQLFGKLGTKSLHMNWTESIADTLRERSFFEHEAYFSDLFEIISAWPKTMIEKIVPLVSPEVSGPVQWEQGRILITTHRKNHLDNIAENMTRASEVGIPVTLVMNGLNDEQRSELVQALKDKGHAFDLFGDDKYGLGYGMTRAVTDIYPDYWIKLDDDDHYTKGYYYEVYSNLRISQCRYVGKNVGLYNFVETDQLFMHAIAKSRVKSSIRGRHVPGATMAGTGKLLFDFEIPRYSAYNMDVAFSRLLEEKDELKFLGTPFFLHVQRFDNALHTWAINQEEWEQSSIELNRRTLQEEVTRRADQGSHDLCILHRVMPGTLGYGAGSYMPEQAMRAGLNILELVLFRQDTLHEPITTRFDDRPVFKSDLSPKTVDRHTLENILHPVLESGTNVFHIMNMPKIGEICEIIRSHKPEAKIIVEIRTPILSANPDRKADMQKALEICDQIITPSDDVVASWLINPSEAPVFSAKSHYVEPSVSPPEACFKDVPNKPLSTGPLKIIYNGSINKKRKFKDIYLELEPLLTEQKMSLSICATADEFDFFIGRQPQEGAKVEFLGKLSKTEMYEVLKAHDIMLAWIPPESFYEDAWSTKILEGAILGLDVIASPTHGHRDMESRGMDLFVFDNTQNGFMAAIEDIKNETPDNRGKRQETSHKSALNFTWVNKLDTYRSAWDV